MKLTPYTIGLSNGNQSIIKARSASDAIQAALEKNPGATVKACRCGLNEEEARSARALGKQGAIAGQIFFNEDIPPHEAYVPGPKKPKAKDGTETMPFFGECLSTKPQ